MPRYFFHLADGHKYLDPFGRLLENDEAAVVEGRSAARYFFAKAGGADVSKYEVEVVAEDGRLVTVIRYAYL